MTMVCVTPDDHAFGTEALLAASRRDLSLVDCVSFGVMDRLGISTCFAYDRHHADRGFELLGRVLRTRGHCAGGELSSSLPAAR